MAVRNRSREGRHVRDEHRAPRESRPRSRSPQRDAGGRRDKRYRSRSPLARDTHSRSDARHREHARDDRRRDDRRGRDPPRGPRSHEQGNAHRHDPNPSHGLPNASNETRKDTQHVKEEDVEMKEILQKPDSMDDETWAMNQVMGFSGFKSTKNTKVPGNDKNYGVRKEKQMEARQYMNRQGGFNRPLSPSRG